MRRNRILVYLLILGSGILVGNFGGSISYLLFYSTLIVPALSLIYIVIVYQKFCIYQEIGTKVLVKEEKVPYLFKLCNEDVLAYTRIQVNFMKDLSTVQNMQQSAEYCMLPQEQIERATTLCCHYRGGYSVGIDEVTVTDYLNLFRFTYKCKSKINVKVLPRVLHLEKLAIAPKSEDMKYQKFSIQTRQEVPDIEVRRYQSSDSPRMIHWKATAKYGELLTRKYTEEPKTELVLIVDFRRLNENEEVRIVIEDKMIEALLAVADYFVRNHTPVSVLFDQRGVQKLPLFNADDFQQLYQICSEVKFQSEINCEKLLTYSMKNSVGRQYCMLLTSSMTNEFCQMAYQYVNMEHELSIVMVGEDTEHEKIKEIDERIHYYKIGKQQEVCDVLEMEEV